MYSDIVTLVLIIDLIYRLFRWWLVEEFKGTVEKSFSIMVGDVIDITSQYSHYLLLESW